ncbi:putative nucleotidyl transferase [Pectobacterium phage PP2]|uniref:Putative nucleotidyl transferase n=1 Tax=Pectobacterium phage PP2 TaxID=1897743 RepID=A0A1W5P4Z7_9CAUD|nr:putative nucleotidyl transferase [Pectobacterium phage PP2]AOT25384.1 putative nucleotidyl transferase [Pectobacterium phage PP2]
MNKTVAKVLALCEVVIGKQGWVVGGAARDIDFGREPSDWDIVIPMGSEDSAHGFQTAEKIFNVLSQELGGKWEVSEAYPEANSSFDQRYLAIVQFEGEDGTSVDILLARAMTCKAVIESFDANINQCALIVPEGIAPCVVWLTPDHVRPTKLEFLRNDLTPERALHVLKIAEEIGIESPSA